MAGVFLGSPPFVNGPIEKLQAGAEGIRAGRKPSADGIGGLPCPHDGTTCLSMSLCCDQMGLCLYPDEALRVCDELPGCFACDVDSGPSGS
jgi:hypothetical protein